MVLPFPSVRYRGFSLVELSIVLVILGLLIGGILSGQALIRAAELRSISAQYQRHVTAVHGFRDKYFQLPGDMQNATQFWGVAGGTGSDNTCALTVSSTPATCNGNGNGKLEDLNDVARIQTENLRFWQHLANAGLIEGTYTGTGDPVAYGGAHPYFAATPGQNVPVGKLNASYWAVEGPCSIGGGMCDNTNIPWGNMLYFGRGPSTYYPSVGYIVNSTDLWNIDTKTDDGMPHSGKVWAICSSTNSLSNTAVTDLAATYVFHTAAIECYFRYPNAF